MTVLFSVKSSLAVVFMVVVVVITSCGFFNESSKYSARCKRLRKLRVSCIAVGGWLDEDVDEKKTESH